MVAVVLWLLIHGTARMCSAVEREYEQIVMVDDVVSALRYRRACVQKDEHGWGIVALMGNTISPAQVEQLQSVSPDVLVCLSDHEASAAVAGTIAGTGLWVSVGSVQDEADMHVAA